MMMCDVCLVYTTTMYAVCFCLIMIMYDACCFGVGDDDVCSVCNDDDVCDECFMLMMMRAMYAF